MNFPITRKHSHFHALSLFVKEFLLFGKSSASIDSKFSLRWKFLYSMQCETWWEYKLEWKTIKELRHQNEIFVPFRRGMVKGFEQFQWIPVKFFSHISMVSSLSQHPFFFFFPLFSVSRACEQLMVNPRQRLCWHIIVEQSVWKWCCSGMSWIKFNDTKSLFFSFSSCLFAYDNQLWCIHQCY